MTLPYAAPPHLSPEHLAELARARERGKKVRRVISVAMFDAWTIAIFGGLTLVTGITSPSSLLLGVGMGIIAWREFSGAAALRR